MKTRKECVFFQDNSAFVVAIILFLSFSASSFWIWHITTLPDTVGSLASIWGSRLLAIALGLLFPILFLVNPDRYLAWFHFSGEGIFYHTLFRKKQFIPYSALPYIHRGKYLHGIHWREYIIFSNRRLSDSELSQINQVAPSKKLIKIRYSEKAKSKLLTILPPKQKCIISGMESSG